MRHLLGGHRRDQGTGLKGRRCLPDLLLTVRAAAEIPSPSATRSAAPNASKAAISVLAMSGFSVDAPTRDR